MGNSLLISADAWPFSTSVQSPFSMFFSSIPTALKSKRRPIVDSSWGRHTVSKSVSREGGNRFHLYRGGSESGTALHALQ